MAPLPTTTVTFLFSDIEGSTRLLQELGDRYAGLLADHHRLLRAAFGERGGIEVQDHGDGFYYTFQSAKAALAAAVAAQRAVLSHPWPEGASVRVRMGLHTGEALSGETGYVGLDIHRTARTCTAGHGGQMLLSQTTRDLADDDLPEGVSLRDLGEHRLKDLTRPQRLFQVVAPDLPSDFPPLRSVDVLPNNLPTELTSFIGREKEKADVMRLLSTTRLVTLTGSGGAGKTRLALQVAAEFLDEYEDGVWLVELAPLLDPNLVPQTVASVFSVREQPGRLLTETLLAHLHPKRLLLILDNCEHLLLACATLADQLLRFCSGLRLLATSREGLGISGEVLYPIPSLALPDPRNVPPPEQLVGYEAVRLFAERAAAVVPTFEVSYRNAHAVTQVCHRLDGIPLALELAAARVKALSVEQIAARLDNRFRLLVGGSRTALPRHQTLKGAMDWSFDLLSQKERVLFCRLSVFAGGFTLEAAEEICSEDGLDHDEILDLVIHLVDKSFMVAEAGNGKVRYRLLESVRQYGWDKLLERGESEGLRARHRDFFLKKVEAGERFGWLAKPRDVEAEHDNFRAALEWSLGSGETESTLRLAAGLSWFWDRRGYYSEGRQWLELALSAASKAPSPHRARAASTAGFFAWHQGDAKGVVALCEESLALYRALGDTAGTAGPLNNLAALAYRQGEYGRAATLLDESISVARGSGNRSELVRALLIRGILARVQGDFEQAKSFAEECLTLSHATGAAQNALALDSLGLLAFYQGDFERARLLCEEALALSRDPLRGPLAAVGPAPPWRGEGGHNAITVGSLNSLGLVACGTGDYERASVLCHEALSLARESGDVRASARSLNTLGLVASVRGDTGRATALHKESLALFRDLGEKLGIAQCFGNLGGLAVARSEPQRAARLFGAAEGLRRGIGAPLPPVERPEYDRTITTTHDRLGGEAFAAAWAEGHAMPLEQAIEYALNENA